MKRSLFKIASCLLSTAVLVACGDDTDSDSGVTSLTTSTSSETSETATDTESATETGTQSGTEAGDGDGDGTGDTGDGDGETATGDGDGETATGDGDGETATGDGDGETATGDGDGDGDGETTTGDGDGESTTGDGDGDGESNWWDATTDVPCPPDGSEDAVLTGTVHAPNGTVPVSGALVYVSDTMPTPPVDGVYCEECVEFNCADTEGTLTDFDGSFTLNADSGNGRYLVIQKGQFLRVTEMDVNPGTTAMAQAQTDLPGEWNPGGLEWIPRIAVGDGSYDRIEDALGKLGLGDTMIASMEETLVGGTASFDLYDNGRDPALDGHTSQGSFASLLDSPSMMAQYHIIFIPCSTDVTSLTAARIQNIRDWVELGGRWYASDYSGEMIRDVFPEYQNFYEQGGSLDLGSYDSDSTTPDQGLVDWLEALPAALKDINPLNNEPHPTLFGLPNIPTEDNWSGIQPNLPQIWVDDGEGGQVNTGHRIWLEGNGNTTPIPNNTEHPLAITAQFGCGKLQFTSFQAAEFFDYVGLSPQELVLMYTILEIGVCQADIPLPE